MRLHMMNCVERLLVHKCERPRRQRPNQQRPHQPGRIRHRNAINLIPAACRLGQGAVDHRGNHLYMAPRRYLWYHTTILGVNVYLRVHHTAQQAPPIGHHRSRRLVAAALNPKNLHRVIIAKESTQRRKLTPK